MKFILQDRTSKQSMLTLAADNTWQDGNSEGFRRNDMMVHHLLDRVPSPDTSIVKASRRVGFLPPSPYRVG